jgi:hypothetical protein
VICIKNSAISKDKKPLSYLSNNTHIIVVNTFISFFQFRALTMVELTHDHSETVEGQIVLLVQDANHQV